MVRKLDRTSSTSSTSESFEERWTPVVFRHFGEAFEKDVYEKYEVSNQCRIKRDGKISNVKGEFIKIFGAGIVRTTTKYRLCLASFYPNDIPNDIRNYHVDHINGVHDDMRLENLQWISPSEHSKKTMKQTKGNRKSIVEKRGKKVVIVDVKGTGSRDVVGKIYGSLACVARELNMHRVTVLDGCRRGHWVKGEYKFKFVSDPDLSGERWVSFAGYQVSSKGRIQHKSGKKTTGTNTGIPRYRRIRIKLPGDNKARAYLVHVIVWLAFNGPIPKGQVVMHTDSYETRDEQGFERNWLVDLSLGTHSQNIQSYHDSQTVRKRIRCIETSEEFPSASKAGKALNIGSSNITSVCNKKRRTTGGYTFEYC